MWSFLVLCVNSGIDKDEGNVVTTFVGMMQHLCTRTDSQTPGFFLYPHTLLQYTYSLEFPSHCSFASPLLP